MNLGILTLLPIVVLFVVIFTTKRMVLALTCATITGAILLAGPIGFAAKWLELIQAGIASGTMGNLCSLLVFFGILIQLLDASGAVTEFAKWISRYANSRRKTLFVTFILGVIIFVDDYLSNLATGTAMKKVADSHKIPRSLLGFIVNCTAAPVCILIPISTWAVFYAGLYEQYGVTVNGSGTNAYLAALPFMFYAWILLAIVLLVIFGVFPLIGRTRKDNKLAMETGVVCSAEVSDKDADVLAPDFVDSADDGVKANPFNFLIPMGVLIAVALLAGNNVLVGCLAGIATLAVMMLVERRMTLNQIFENSYKGVMSMIPMCIIVTLACCFIEINLSSGLAEFVIGVLSPLLKGFYLPALVFAFTGIYCYFGGGFWDSSLIFMPIVVPLTVAVGGNPLLSCAALTCAAAAGSTTYVCGDGVLIASSAVEIKPMYQMMATLPYALIAYALTIVCFFVAGIVL